MTDLAFCPECMTERATRVEQRRHALAVRGEPIEVQGEVRVCPICDTAISDVERDNRLLVSAYDVYRQRHNLLRPADIRRMRERYDLSQRAMAKLLGLGLVTIQRYEAGALQDECHDQLLRCFADPTQARQMAQRHHDAVPPKQWHAFQAALDRVAAADPPLGMLEAAVLARREGDGRDPHARDTVAAVVRYLLSRATGRERDISRTQLVKLWWLSDFLHYRTFGRGITGVRYVPLPHGPVPDDYKEYLNLMERRGDIVENPVFFGAYEGYVYRAGAPDTGESLDPSERAAIDVVVDSFGAWSAKDLSDAAHAEAAWPDFERAAEVPYAAANTLSMLDGLEDKVSRQLEAKPNGGP